MTEQRPGRIELMSTVVPVQRTGGPSRGRARAVVAAWVLGLTAVAALGVIGQQAGQDIAVAPVASIAVVAVRTPAPVTPAPTTLVSAMDAATWPPIVQYQIVGQYPLPGRAIRRPITRYRVLGEDGLVGGIVFGSNIPASGAPD